ncbi:Ferredoxin (4Fe-4S iron-sulfur cluster binding protein) [Desulfamplus magnetovallimortis]|uniref:Ferredoxin (4Fe-4S iron-sulfur cluster binding protein) n=1 Tax=Desulfamplus magnetovallimortis TaxID=1246637 RepID=A0A1W1HB43_9BACT|nr:4Fe-4S binding protein [Desulfamplus magnetovallimortis]SLM29714.1 Ferredoxin (4Fe-4S iron-sulfur cluster binding protein) [Desulfamplus magnetovallimortis]
MKIKRKIIEIDEELCDGCGNCVPSCAEGAIQIIDGKAKVVKDQYCDGLGACLGECPQNALKLVEREAEEFDEEAVERYLKSIEQGHNSLEQTGSPLEQGHKSLELKNDKAPEQKNIANKPGIMGCGCPSTQIQTFTPARKQGGDAHNNEANYNKSNNPSGNCNGEKKKIVGSALGHWPVQIRLVPATAPFLKGADLLVTADCVPVAYPSLHSDFLEGKVVMMGCPKFDDVNSYAEKFTQIFQTAGIKSITVLIMEVPCCSGMPLIIKKAMEDAGVDLPVQTLTVSTRGEILS